MKNYQAKVISIALCFSAMIFSGAGFAAEKADPGKNATWTGEAGKDNYIGNCAACHGETGKGDGPLAESLGEGIKPKNISDAKLLSTRTDEYLFKVIKFGGKAVKLSESMPDWKDTFTDAEIKQIVQYVREQICKCKPGGKK